MAKAGILHDYDLMANAEPATQREETVCPICDASPPAYQWSDYSGEAMCMQCGCPFQLKWGSEQQKAEDKYPYLNLKEEWVPVVREYWDKHHTFVCHGEMLGDRPGLVAFFEWAKAQYSDMCKADD